MALMHKMRENMTYILFFLLIMFLASMTIGGLVGGANILDILSGKRPDTILKINGEEISYDQFTRYYNQEIENFKQQNGKDPEGYQLQQIENKVWDAIIRDVLKQQMIQKLGIKATDEEIKYYIFTSPHPIFQMDRNFLDENQKFDLEKFKTALSSPGNDLYWRYKEDQLRTIIPFEKLDDEVISTVKVTEQELKEEFLKKNQKIKVRYVFFDPNNFMIADEDISDEEIKAYYEQHLDDYKEPEKRQIKYVLFSISPTAADSAATYKMAESIMNSAKEGEDFAELAKTYSDDPGSAENGGDLGYFARGAMVKPFEDAAFSAKVGDIVGPVKSNFGLHIIKVEDKKVEDGTEKVKARHILLKFKASRETQDNAKDNADYFVELAKEQGFDQAVTSTNAVLDTTNYFTDSGFIPKLGMQKRISRAIFAKSPDEVSKSYFIDNRGYIVFQVKGIKKAGIKALEVVKSSIRSKIRRQKQMEKAKEVAQKFRENINVPEDFQQLALKDSLQITETGFFTREGSVTGVGRDLKFIGAAFALEKDEISNPVEGIRGYYVIQLIEKQPFDEKAYAAQKENLHRQLLETKRRTIYNAWLANMKEQADIKDYRYLFF